MTEDVSFGETVESHEGEADWGVGTVNAVEANDTLEVADQ